MTPSRCSAAQPTVRIHGVRRAVLPPTNDRRCARSDAVAIAVETERYAKAATSDGAGGSSHARLRWGRIRRRARRVASSRNPSRVSCGPRSSSQRCRLASSSSISPSERGQGGADDAGARRLRGEPMAGAQQTKGSGLSEKPSFSTNSAEVMVVESARCCGPDGGCGHARDPAGVGGCRPRLACQSRSPPCCTGSLSRLTCRGVRLSSEAALHTPCLPSRTKQ